MVENLVFLSDYAIQARTIKYPYFFNKSMIAQNGIVWNPDKYRANAILQKNVGLEAIKRLSIQSTDYILDVGCGDGTLSLELAKMVPQGRIVASDICEHMVGKTAATFDAHNIRNYDVVCTNATHINYFEEFDIVFSNIMAHFVPNQKKLYHKLAKALKPGGHLMLSVFVESREIDPITGKFLPEEDTDSDNLCDPWKIATSIFYDIINRDGSSYERSKLHLTAYTILTKPEIEHQLHRNKLSVIELEPYIYEHQFSNVQQYIDYEEAVDWVSILNILTSKHRKEFLQRVKSALLNTPNLNLYQTWKLLFVHAVK